jgi:hypothetical protein
MKHISRLTAGVLFLAATLFLAGCKTDADHANSGQMASVEVSGHTEVEVLKTVKDVFESNGYEHMGDLTFDKKGSLWDTAAYGGWDSGGVWTRLKATVDPAPDGVADHYVIGCDAYRVIRHNQGVMEDEEKTRYSNRAECARIVNEIQARLAGGAVPVAQP